jgi:hypothetical protein
VSSAIVETSRKIPPYSATSITHCRGFSFVATYTLRGNELRHLGARTGHLRTIAWRDRRRRTTPAQLSSTCLIMVVPTHVCEAHHLFPWMGWALRHSVGHYLDLSSAILGLALLPVGFMSSKTLARPSTITRGA